MTQTTSWHSPPPAMLWARCRSCCTHQAQKAHSEAEYKQIMDVGALETGMTVNHLLNQRRTCVLSW